MEQEKRSFVHDTINLEEIKELLGENPEMILSESPEDDPDQLSMLPQDEEELIPEQLSMPMEEETAEQEENSAVEEHAAETEDAKSEDTATRKKTNWA